MQVMSDVVEVVDVRFAVQTATCELQAEGKHKRGRRNAHTLRCEFAPPQVLPLCKPERDVRAYRERGQQEDSTSACYLPCSAPGLARRRHLQLGRDQHVRDQEAERRHCTCGM